MPAAHIDGAANLICDTAEGSLASCVLVMVSCNWFIVGRVWGATDVASFSGNVKLDVIPSAVRSVLC